MRQRTVDCGKGPRTARLPTRTGADRTASAQDARGYDVAFSVHRTTAHPHPCRPHRCRPPTRKTQTACVRASSSATARAQTGPSPAAAGPRSRCRRRRTWECAGAEPRRRCPRRTTGPGTCAPSSSSTTSAPSCCGTTGARPGRRALEMDSQHKAVLDQVAQYTCSAPAEPAHDAGGALLRLRPQRPAHACTWRATSCALIGQLTLDIGTLLRAPHRAPWRDFSGHLYQLRRHRAADHRAGGPADRRGAGLPHLAAAAPVRRRDLHRQHPRACR